jgi:hypothetical protein
MRGKFGSVPSQRLYKKEVLRAVADSDPNMHKVIYGGSFGTHVASKTFTKALKSIHGGEGKIELTEKARRMLGLDKGQEIKGGKEKMVENKLNEYFREEAANAEPKTEEKSALERTREERLRQANILIGRSQRLRAEEANKKSSGFANPNVQAGYAGGRDDSVGTSATTPKNAQGSVSGDPTKNVAGLSAAQHAAGAPVPGQLNADKPASPSSRPVQLTSLSGLAAPTEKHANSGEDSVVPRIGISADKLNNDDASQEPAKIMDLPSRVKSEKDQDSSKTTDPKPAKDDDVNIEEGLPL